MIVLVLNIAVSGQNNRTFAVVGPVITSKDFGSDITAIKNKISTVLHQATGNYVWEQELMNTVLMEQNFKELNNCATIKCCVKAGQLMGVDRVFSGSIAQKRGALECTLFMVDVAEGKIVNSVFMRVYSKGNTFIEDELPAAVLSLLSSDSRNSSQLAKTPSGKAHVNKVQHRKPIDEKRIKRRIVLLIVSVVTVAVVAGAGLYYYKNYYHKKHHSSANSNSDDIPFDDAPAHSDKDSTSSPGTQKTPVDVPVDKPVDVPVDKPVDVPVDKPVDVPVDKPVDVPVDKPVDVPVDKPVDVPVDVPKDIPYEDVPSHK
jgi:hypothetical protein